MHEAELKTTLPTAAAPALQGWKRSNVHLWGSEELSCKSSRRLCCNSRHSRVDCGLPEQSSNKFRWGWLTQSYFSLPGLGCYFYGTIQSHRGTASQSTNSSTSSVSQRCKPSGSGSALPCQPLPQRGTSLQES